MSTLWLIIIFGGIAFGVLVVIGIAITTRSEKSLVEERLGRYIEEEGGEVIPKGSEKRASPLADWLNRRLEKSKYGGGISRELARADVKLKPAEYVALMVIAAVGVGFVAWFIGGRSIIFGIIGAVIGLMLPRIQVGRLQKKRQIRFGDQLADMLNLMVNGLRAGYSTMQAMEAVSKEMPAPICDEFRRVVQEMQLGIAMEVALANLLRRIPSEDMDLVVTAINVQREVGGNLAEILDTISYTIRERVRIKGEIRVLTSQVMYSGRFMSLLPVILALVLWVLNRDYMMEFFNPETRLAGYVALGIGAGMTGLGYFIMNKIGDIEV